MQEHKKIPSLDKDSFYKILIVRLEGMLSSESDTLANISNASALLYNNLDNINWAGFYILRGEELVLGPFQGRCACTRIKMGKGVCGTCAQKREIITVGDVSSFPGHIACDSASKSEVVLPIIYGEKFAGVLDIDSPILERFDALDASYLKKFVDKLNKYVDWTKIC